MIICVSPLSVQAKCFMVRGGEGGHYVSLSGNRVWSETWWESKLEKVVKEKVAERNKGSVYHSTFSGRDTPRLSRHAPPPCTAALPSALADPADEGLARLTHPIYVFLGSACPQQHSSPQHGRRRRGPTTLKHRRAPVFSTNSPNIKSKREHRPPTSCTVPRSLHVQRKTCF